MVSVNINDESPTFRFSGKSYRIFIEGRGFDFESFEVYNNRTASLNLTKLDDPLFTILDFQEPRVIYVVSRKGHQDLILQGFQQSYHRSESKCPPHRHNYVQGQVFSGKGDYQIRL